MKKEYIIILFLLLGPILDVTSFLGYPFSIIIRGLFLVSIIIWLVLKKRELKLLLPLLIFSIILFSYQYFILDFSLMGVVSAILKFLYLPISLLFFKSFILPVEKSKALMIILFTYLGIYLGSYLLGTGSDAYLATDGKSGFKGMFSSINEFSAIIVGLLPIVSTRLKNNKKWILLVLLILSSLFCSLLIGTKVLMGGIIFTIFYLLYQEREKLFFNKPKKIKIAIIVSFIILIVIGCLLFTKTRTYQNMVVQQNFFKVENILSFDFVNRVVYNDRLTFLKTNFDYFKTQNILEILLGIGINNYDVKMVEIDIFDIIFRYGIIGIIIFIGTSYFSINIKNLKQEEKISSLLFIIISLTSGHVLIYPAVSIYIATIFGKDNLVKK